MQKSLMSCLLLFCSSAWAMEREHYIPDTITPELKAAAEAGQARAQYKLAECYALGHGVDKSIESAKIWYEKAGSQGHVDAQYRLARIFANEKTYVPAAQWYLKAAQQGHILAQCELADLYLAGRIPQALPSQAIEWYKKAIATVLVRPDVGEDYKQSVQTSQADAAYTLADIYEHGSFNVPQNYNEALRCYQKSLEYNPNHARSLCGLALLYVRGCAVQKDIKKAKELLLKAAQTQYAQAYTQLGNLALEEKAYAEAIAHYTQAIALKEDKEAQYKLGLCYENGFGVTKNLPVALSFYAKSAKQIYAPALGCLTAHAQTQGEAACILGTLSQEGKGVPKDLTFAACYYNKAIVLGYVRALNLLETLAQTNADAQYACGGICLSASDEERALFWFVKAAGQGNYAALEKMVALTQSPNGIAVKAHKALGLLYLDGVGVTQDARKAVTCFTAAANSNDAEGCYLLGRCYLLGHGIKASEQNAIDWYTKAADRYEPAAADLMRLSATNAEAACVVGELHEEGKGREKSEASAIIWYKIAASKGLAKAYFKLGFLCENRQSASFERARDVLSCYEEALIYYKKAADLRYVEAIDAVDRVTAVLDDLQHLKEPDFRNFTFNKLRALFARNAKIDLAPDLLYWFASTCDLIRTRCSDVIQDIVGIALTDLAQFPKLSKQARAVLKVMYQLIETENFSANPLAEQAEAYRIFELGRICKGISLISRVHNAFQNIGTRALRRADDSIRDVRIEVFNCIFRAAQKPADQSEYVNAVNNIVEMFNQGIRDGKITNDMRNDPDGRGLGTNETLRQLLTYHKDDRFKNRIIRIAHILAEKLDQGTRYAQVAMWSAAGYYCSTRSEEETYKFYVQNVTDARSLDEDGVSLEMRIALSLAELRKRCLSSIVPMNAHERIHQIAYLEKKVAGLLALTGDAERFRDRYEWAVVSLSYRAMHEQEIMNRILSLYTMDAMVQCVLEEANKLPRESRIPYNAIAAYFDQIPGGSSLLSQLFDEDGRLTLAGAKAILYNFGYLE